MKSDVESLGINPWNVIFFILSVCTLFSICIKIKNELNEKNLNYRETEIIEIILTECSFLFLFLGFLIQSR